MKSLIYPLRTVGLLTVALTVALAANFAYGQWTNPTAAPPGGQVAVPVHTATSTQVKTGNFGAVDILAAGVSEAGSHMASPVYCDERGFGVDGNPFTSDDDCFYPSDVGSGGGGSITGSALQGASKMYQAFNTPPPNGMYAWPDWITCGGSYDIAGNRVYKENYSASGVDRKNYNSDGSGDCGGIRDICLTRTCGIYGTGASGADLVINPGDICNAYGCSEFGACAAGGCPSSAAETCNQYGCSEFGACAAGGCPMSAGETCNAYGCS